MTNLLLFLKGLHVVGFVSWFAGLFYLVRIFVYYTEAGAKAEPDRTILTREFGLMQQRVYKIICNPAMMITWTAGIGMLLLGLFHPSISNYLDPSLGGWMYFKLFFLFLLTGYHHWCKRIITELENGNCKFDSFQFRLFNEVPTLFLVSISFTAVYGNVGLLNYGYLLLGVGIFGCLVYRGAVAYRKRREQMDK